MKILLSTATLEDNPAMIKAIEKVFSVSEPLGLAYLAAVLKQNNYNVKVLDALAEGYHSNDLELFLSKEKYDVIGISTYTPDWYVVKTNLLMIKRLQPMAKIIIGGPHVNSTVRAGLAKTLFDDTDCFDVAVYGEGEQTLLDIIRAIEKKKSLDDINGIIWKDAHGTTRINPPRELIKNIDDIPFPALELFPLPKYKRTPSSYKKAPVRSVMTARGCPFSCIFCDRGAFGSSVRKRSIENTILEIDRLVTEFKTKEIRFWDDVFTMNEKFVINICNELKKYNLIWTCNARVNMINPRMLTHMKDAGCWAVDFGIESGNDKILKIIKKEFNTNKASEAIKMVKRSGIEVRAFFILGFPEETVETIQDTINFAVSNDIDYATFYLTHAYPGTRLYEIAQKEGSLEKDLSKFLVTGKDPSYINSNIGLKALQVFQKNAYRAFYRRSSYIAKMLLKIRNLEDIKRYLSAASIFSV